MAETLPEVPKRRPASDAMESWLETLRFVVVALVEVLFEKMAVEGVAAPIGVFSMVPPEMVRSSATRAFASVPVQTGVKVKVVPEFVTLMRRLVSDEVAMVSAPVCAEPYVCWSDETPEPLLMHVPFTAKQPAERSIPCAKVEVAEPVV
jgi:hypothetical protein